VYIGVFISRHVSYLRSAFQIVCTCLFLTLRFMVTLRNGLSRFSRWLLARMHVSLMAHIAYLLPYAYVNVNVCVLFEL
jgi:hypothetical protein